MGPAGAGQAVAAAHPDGIVDLSIGTPVDPVPALIRRGAGGGLGRARVPADRRLAHAAGGDHRLGVTRLRRRPAGFGVLPTIGSKELVAWLPTLLGVGPGDVVVIPPVCYPTYEVGARLAGADRRTDRLADRRWSDHAGPPGLGQLAVQPDRPGAAAGAPAQSGRLGPRARRRGRQRRVLPVAGLGRLTPVSVLSPQVCGGVYDGRPGRAFAVQAVQPRRLPGRFRGRRPTLVAELLTVRKHAGMIMPAPVQAAMVAALGDESHVMAQRSRYAARRELLRPAFASAGFTIEHSQAGLYLWATRGGEDCWSTVDWLARRGILAARARSTARPASGTCGWRSPPPTSGSPRPPTASRSEEAAPARRRPRRVGRRRPGRTTVVAMAETPIVAVRGETLLEVAPEIARFTVTVAARDKDRQTTLTRLAQRVDAIRAVLDSHGPAIERRETGAVQVRPELKRSGERVAAYVASLATTVTVTDFAVLGDLMLRLADEDQTSVYGPWWALRPNSPVHRQARRAAVDDAVTRAREYADAVGSELGALLELADSGMSSSPPVPMAYGGGMQTMRAAAGTPELDLEPQQQTVQASVEMRFTMTEPTGLTKPRD